MLFHLLMQSLVIYGICPDQGSNPPLWYIRQRSNQLSYPARAAFFVNYFMSPPISSNIVYSFLHHHPELPTLCFTEKIKVATQEFLRFFLKIFFLLLERGREGEGERNTSVWLPLPRPPPGTWPATQACALSGNRTHDPVVCRLAFNPHVVVALSLTH